MDWTRALLSSLPQPPLGKLPEISRAEAAGISVAVAGNVLISFALNCQKLAHRRLERDREQRQQANQSLYKNGASAQRIDEEEEGDEAEIVAAVEETHPEGGSDARSASAIAAPAVAILETQPLLPNRTTNIYALDYGSDDPQRHGRTSSSPSLLARLNPWRRRAAKMSHIEAEQSLLPVDIITVDPGTPHNGDSKGQETAEDSTGSESDYLKSKLWWLGLLLMNVGEIGNFISYAFAPASIVAPLGTFALVANCFFAPLMLRERFRMRDVLGIMVAIVGAVTVVLSANPSDVQLDPEGLIRAFSQRPFLIYSIVYIVGAIILSGLSESEFGKSHVFVDVGLCGLFGGFTVLSTKAISTLLTKEWFEIFTEWITYPVIAVLLGTGVGQIRYLNRALMRFDSKIVVPTQFVMFNLSAIVGSAILYGDFKRATFHQIVTFLYGCGATFAGVFIIAWAPNNHNDSDQGQDQAEDDVEAGTSATPSETLSPNVGNLSRRNRATLVIPEHAIGSNSSSPVLRRRQSIVSLIGLSPAQYSQRLLLVNTPPLSEFVRPIPPDLEGQVSPGSFRRRTLSSLGDDPRTRRPGRRTISAVTSRETSRSRELDSAAQSPRRSHR